jgi:AraC family transcriptional regulator
MDTLAGMNAAPGYIEANLSGHIDLREAARLAYCSEYHSRRLLSSLPELP